MSNSIKINVCMGTGGIAAGGDEVMDAFNLEFQQAGLKEASVEKHCAVHRVGCRGFCARDVLVDISIDDVRTTYQYIKADMVPRLVKEHIVGGTPVEDWVVGQDYHDFHDRQEKVVLADCGEIDPEDIQAYLDVEGYKGVIKALAEMTPVEVIECVKNSGLKGRGGAGFPTGVKWQFCAGNESDQKYIICNADEGDPGAFMDRSVIEGNPHAVIEGMSIAAYAIGANKGYVYIRAEYPLAVERLHRALSQARDHGFLGKEIHGTSFDFDIKVKLGAGAFVCGEETALIASIEGQRGMPRAKPPFPAAKGLWDKPTVINNVETLANLPFILRKGAEWFSSLGSETSKGTKVFALTGKIRNTGLIEVPMGIPLRDIIYDIGGGIENNLNFKAVQTGGPSGGCITAEHIDLPVDYENLLKVGSMMGSGGMVVLDENDCMVNISKFFLEFTQSESCGKCTPCRIGTKRLLEILTRITEGKGKKSDIDLLLDMAVDIKETSLCGLGMSAPNPVLSTIKYFRDEYEAHINDKRCPAAVCRSLLTFSVIDDTCKGCGICLKACPASAITGEKKKIHYIDTSLCVKCGACFDVCKFKAILKK